MKKRELRKIIRMDKKNYSGIDKMHKIYYFLTQNQRRQFLKNIICARKLNFYKNKKGIFAIIGRLYYERKYNIISLKNNINIRAKFGKNLKVSHENIVVNQYAILGDNVILHGNNCIGNLNNGKKDAPKIGNNVDIGYGATIIGGIELADNIIVGANSLVNKSFLEKGIIIAGSPAKIIGKK